MTAYKLMPPPTLKILEKPAATNARMLLGLSGWMDGGDVSTGTVDYLRETLGGSLFAEIDPSPFYIYGFPGSMEFTTLFRPRTTIEEGLVADYKTPANTFYWCPKEELILLDGKEPNLDWNGYADCVFSLAEEISAGELYYVGSYAGAVPHHREPRLYATASDPALRDDMASRGFRVTSYEGPAGIISHLLHEAPARGLRMTSIVAEIPAYLQGRNPHCIETMTRTIGEVLGIEVDTGPLRPTSELFMKEITKMVKENDDLAKIVQKLEAEYDMDYMETEMGDLREWLRGQGFEIA